MLKTSNTRPRIAIIQHGDYASAFRTFRDDLPEPYAGMKNTVAAIENVIADQQFLLISLDGESYRSAHYQGTLIGLPPHKLPRLVPRRLAAAWQRAHVLAEVRNFAPTHLLLRTSGQLAIDLLSYCASHGTQSLVIFANVFDPQRQSDPATRRLIELLNQPFVERVANHLQPAADSMIECGLRREKAVAYDVDLPQNPVAFEPKELNAGESCELVFAGSLVYSKGCEDVVLAAAELHRRGIPVRLSVFGDGPDRGRLVRIAASLPSGMITFHGRQPNNLLVQAMRSSTFVCVPSHREFPEGMPLTLIEGLTTRSPVIASDHPVFIRAFQDGEGLRFVPEKQPLRIADTIEQLWNDSCEYRRLSESTAQALVRIKCPTLMSSLLKDWAQDFVRVRPAHSQLTAANRLHTEEC